MRARLVTTLTALATAASLVAGCAQGTTTPQATPTPTDNGISALTADQILEKAKAALGAADNYRVKGSASEDNEKVSIDFKIAGDNVAGTVAVQGTTIDIVRIGNDAYLKADALWQMMLAQQPQALALIKGKYVKVPANDDRFKEFTSITDPETLLKPEGTPTKGEPKTVNGKQTITLVDSKDNGKLYIATVGEPLPVRLEDSSGNGVDFTYDETFTVTAPDASQVVDASTLPGF